MKAKATPAKIIPSDKEWDDFRTAVVKSVQWLELEDRVLDFRSTKMTFAMPERIVVKARCTEGAHDFDVCPNIAKVLTRNVGRAMDGWTQRFSFVTRGSKVLCEVELTRGKMNLRADLSISGVSPLEGWEREMRRIML